MELPGIITNIARDERDNFVIDTVKVNGYYETAIKHRDFNDNHWIILERYDNEEEANGSHEFYVRVFSTYDINKIADIYDDIYKRQED